MIPGNMSSDSALFQYVFQLVLDMLFDDVYHTRASLAIRPAGRPYPPCLEPYPFVTSVGLLFGYSVDFQPIRVTTHQTRFCRSLVPRPVSYPMSRKIEVPVCMERIMNEDKSSDSSSRDCGSGFTTAPNDPWGPELSPGDHIGAAPQLRSNHAELVLLLGIISLFMCGPLGIVAWIMGNSDLKRIRRGLMSSRKIGTLKVGKALGIVGTCLFAATFIFVGLIAQHRVQDLVWTWRSTPLRPDQLVFAGEWVGKTGTRIVIRPNGQGDFRSRHTALTGGHVRIEDESLSIGIAGLWETWHIDKRPYLENDVWRMELDHEVFVRRGEGYTA